MPEVVKAVVTAAWMKSLRQFLSRIFTEDNFRIFLYHSLNKAEHQVRPPGEAGPPPVRSTTAVGGTGQEVKTRRGPVSCPARSAVRRPRGSRSGHLQPSHGRPPGREGTGLDPHPLEHRN